MTPEILKNHHGMIVGRIKQEKGDKLWIYNKNECCLGYYDPQTNKTHDKNHSLVGSGNLLANLLTLR